MSTIVSDYVWKICFVIFSVEYLYYPFSGISSTDRFLSLARVVSQCSGHARFELQVRNIPHREEDIIYGNGLLFEVQYRPDIVPGKIVVALWDGGRIEIYEPTGAKVSEIKLGVSRPTCCTFAGPNQDILIVSTASQGIDRADEPLAGKILAVTGTGLSGLPTQQYG